MLKGKELGQAIDIAIKKKIALGTIRSKADVAKHFGIKTPSVYDWIKKGSISKDKLFALWDYFSDVVGPDHWGVERLYPEKEPSGPIELPEATTAGKSINPSSRQRQVRIDAINQTLADVNDDGLLIILGSIKEIAKNYRVLARKKRA